VTGEDRDSRGNRHAAQDEASAHGACVHVRSRCDADLTVRLDEKRLQRAAYRRRGIDTGGAACAMTQT